MNSMKRKEIQDADSRKSKERQENARESKSLQVPCPGEDGLSRLPLALQERHQHEILPRPVGQAVGLAQRPVAGEAELGISRLGPRVVGEAVEGEALGAEARERLADDEAQERGSEALAGPRHGDALEIEVAVRIAEPPEDGEGLDRAD